MKFNWPLFAIFALLLTTSHWPKYDAIIIPAIIAYVTLYFSQANVVRMTEISELENKQLKNEETIKKLTTSLSGCVEHIKALSKKNNDIKDSISAINKKFHRPVPHIKSPPDKRNWNDKAFAIKNPNKQTEPKSENKS